MSDVLKNDRARIDVTQVGTEYLFKLATRLSPEQRASLILEYKARGHANAAHYALNTANQWALGIVKPRPETKALYLQAIRSVISPEQKIDLLRLECSEFSRRLSFWSKEPNDSRTLTMFFSKACENPVCVAPSFMGMSSQLFTKEQIDEYLLSCVAEEVFRVAEIVSRMALIQNCDDIMDSIRSPWIQITLRHKNSGLCIDVSERMPSNAWTDTYKSFITTARNYNNAIDLQATRLEPTESQTITEEFKVLIKKLSNRYYHDLAHSRAERVSTSIEHADWMITCTAPYSSVAVISRDLRLLRWALLVTGNVLIYLMFTTLWLLVFIGAFAFAAMISSLMNSSVNARTVESLRERLLVAGEVLPVYPETTH